MTKMEYVLLSKKQNDVESDKAVNQDVRAVFGSANNDAFNVVVRRTNVELRYTMKKRRLDAPDGHAYYITLFTNEKNKKRAVEALEDAHRRVTQDGEFRKKYHVVVLSDDVSSYYCVKAYPVFHEYEKQIRRLIYKHLTMSLGVMWIDKTVDEELKNQLKERTKGISSEKLIVQMLHEMDMSQLEQYLFSSRRETSASDMIDKHLSDANIEGMTKEEMAATIQRSRPQSVWERYFAAHIEIEDLQSKMTTVRDNRNKVAHCKPFYSNDFSDSMKVLKEDGLIDKLTNATENIRTKELSLVTMQDVLHGLAEFGRFFKAAAVIVTPALVELADFMQSIRNSIIIPGIINPLVEALEVQRQINEAAMSPLASLATEQTQSINNAIDYAHLNAFSDQLSINKNLVDNPLMEHIRRAEELNRLYDPPLAETLSMQNEISEHIANNNIINESYTEEEVLSDATKTAKDDNEKEASGEIDKTIDP